MKSIATILVLVAAGSARNAPPSATQPSDQVGDQPSTQPTLRSTHDLFFDPADGGFDASGFLSLQTGFLPVVVPITEPAVGYGAGGAVAFFHSPPRVMQTPAGPRMIPPNTTILGGMATENGSWGAFAGHLHTWDDGCIRYLVGGGYASLNLEWFGQRDAFAGRAFDYTSEGVGLVQKLTFKIGETDFFIGPMQKFLATKTNFAGPALLPLPIGTFGILPEELDANISGLGLTLGYDTRNSLFSPTRGTKASITYLQNFEAIGSDFNYGRLDVEVCQYVPLGGPFTLGLRGAASWVGDNAPFFDLGSIGLRGVQAGRFVDNAMFTAEAELRWDVTQRWTLLTFGGAGWVADEFSQLDGSDAHWAGGAGFRYLLARRFDLRMGADIARGEEDWAFYVTVGTGWLRD